MTIEGRIDAYRRGELSLDGLVAELPVVADASPELLELLDALEAGHVPPEVVSAWSHPEVEREHGDPADRATPHANNEPHPPHDGHARREPVHAAAYHPAAGTSPTRAWKFIPKPMVD